MAGPTNPKVGLQYDAPVAYTDGTALVLGDLAGFEIGVGTTSKVYTKIVPDTAVEQTGRQLTSMAALGNLGFGQFYTAVRALSKAGKVSDWSSEVAFVMSPPVPQAPLNPSIA